MNQLRLTTLGFILMLLFGCATTFTSPPSAKLSMRACKSQCLNKFKACAKVCKYSCQKCMAFVTTGVKRHYDYFVHQQQVQGGLVARELNSYRDPLQCLKSTCDCRADSNECTQACAGTIHKRPPVPRTCC